MKKSWISLIVGITGAIAAGFMGYVLYEKLSKKKKSSEKQEKEFCFNTQNCDASENTDAMQDTGMTNTASESETTLKQSTGQTEEAPDHEASQTLVNTGITVSGASDEKKEILPKAAISSEIQRENTKYESPETDLAVSDVSKEDTEQSIGSDGEKRNSEDKSEQA